MRIMFILLAVCVLTACTSSPSPVPGPESKAIIPVEQPVTVALAELPPVIAPSLPSKQYRLVGVRLVDKSGKVTGKLITTYDASGRVAYEDQFRGEKQLQSRKNFTWNPDGSVDIAIMNDLGRVLARSRQDYDQGRLVKVTYFTAEKIMQSVEEYRYDSQGNKISWLARNPVGLQNSSEYLWEKGRNVKIIVKDGAGKISKTYNREFTAEGNIGLEIELSPEGVVLSRTAYFYENGRLIREETQTPEGKRLTGTLYSHDESGNVVKIAAFNENTGVFASREQIWEELNPRSEP